MVSPSFSQAFERVIRRHLRLIATSESIPAEATLVSAGLDSVGTISLLFDIEEEFSVTLPASMLTPETFHTRGSLESAVAALLETT